VSDHVLRFPPMPVPPPSASEHARAETERKRRLFAWVDALIRQLDLDRAIAQASTFEELRKIVIDVDSAEVTLAIREALRPTSGQKADYLAGLREGALKRVLRMRFAEIKQEREAALRTGAGGTRSAPDWTADLILDPRNGAVRPVLANLIRFLRFHPAWEGVLAYDEFHARVVIKRAPPWESEAPGAPWIDHHESLTRVWLQHEDLFAGLGDVGRAVQAAARHAPFHPVREHLEALTWDGTPRLDTWLQTYFHVEDSDYARAIGPRYLISAVARVYQPGCQVDHMIILEGTQGRLKSQALRILAMRDEWFTDRLSHMHSKDAALETVGVLIIELAELDALTRAASSATKSFLTRPHEKLRLPYGRHQISFPRQCVFAGTINPPVGGYLKDPTGARRFWPVTCRGRIDRDGLERDRDQLWAEAVRQFKAGAKWWLETPELEALATAEQRARYVTDVWTARVVEWVEGRHDVSVTEVLSKALGLAEADHTQRAMNRAAAILTSLGFVRVRARKGAKRENQRETRYRRES
jgi:putative DNA primase/helicase